MYWSFVINELEPSKLGLWCVTHP